MIKLVWRLCANIMINKGIPDVGSTVRQLRIDKGMTIEALSRITKIKIEELTFAWNKAETARFPIIS